MDQRKRLRAYGPWVISLVALFVAFSSSAGALKGKNTVDSGDIKPSAVHSGDIAKYGVNTADVAPVAVEGFQVAPYTLTGGNIKPGSIGGGSLSTLKLVFGDFKQFGSKVPVSATCPAGTRLISGGIDTGGNGEINSSYPDASNLNPNPKTWKGVVSGNGFAAAYALCLES